MTKYLCKSFQCAKKFVDFTHQGYRPGNITILCTTLLLFYTGDINNFCTTLLCTEEYVDLILQACHTSDINNFFMHTLILVCIEICWLDPLCLSYMWHKFSAKLSRRQNHLFIWTFRFAAINMYCSHPPEIQWWAKLQLTGQVLFISPQITWLPVCWYIGHYRHITGQLSRLL